MKTKHVSLFLLLAMLATSHLNAQYRVKSVTCINKHMKKMIECSHTLNYDGQGNIISIDARETLPKEYNLNWTEEHVETKNIPAVYEKGLIKIARDSKYGNTFYTTNLTFDKQNRMTGYHNLAIVFEKDGKFKEFKKNDSKYEVQYDEQGRLSALLNRRTTQMSSHIYYGENNLPNKITLRSDESMETVAPFWSGTRLDSLVASNRNNEITQKMVFAYDNNNNLVDQKIFRPLPSYEREVATDNSLRLFTHYIITYELGKGNDREVYLQYNDWLVNIFLNSPSFDTFFPSWY